MYRMVFITPQLASFEIHGWCS